MKQVLLFLILFIITFFRANAKDSADIAYINNKTVEKTINKNVFTLFITRGKNYVWKYNDKDSSNFKERNYNDSAWERRLSMVRYDTISNKNAMKGIVWFRLPVKADSTMLNEPLTLHWGGVGVMEVYFDGRLLHKIGQFATEGQKHKYLSLKWHPVFLTIKDTALHVLAIRYEYNDAVKNDISWGFNLQVESAYHFFYFSSNSIISMAWLLVGLGTVFFTLFIVHLLMFLFYRKEISNLPFSVFTLSLSIMLYAFYFMYYLDNSTEYYSPLLAIVGCSVIVGFTSLNTFMAVLFHKRNVFLKITLIIGVVTLLACLIDLKLNSDLTTLLVGILLLFSCVYATTMTIVAMIKRLPGAFILGSGIIFFLLYWIAVAIWVAVLKYRLKLDSLFGILGIVSLVSIPISISAFLAWRFANTSRNLRKQLKNVETLSAEKQTILENQKAALEKEVIVRTQEIREEKQRSDDLLLNILPAEVAEELKLNGESKAQRYDEVSVLFTDFVNFTQTSEKMGVEQLLKELNINFTTFDHIIEKYGLEKIKTIGDAYLAVCGLPVSNLQHAQNTVNAAIEIAAFVSKRKQETPFGLDIRIGVNSGSLIAGIVGVKKFAYDIWGDTVNTAARMEQNSEAGKVNVSQATYLLIKDEFDCKHRGKVTVKGKGEMDMYFVTPKEKKETLENP